MLERGSLCRHVGTVLDTHRRMPLAAMTCECRELGRGIDRFHTFEVVDLVGFEQQQPVRAMRAFTVSGKEVRVARRDERVDGQPAGVAMVGMKPVSLPGVM